MIRAYLQPGARVLDAGCGFGEWVTFLIGRGMAAEGVDYSSDLIRRLEATYPKMHWTHSEIQSMPYADGIFDGVVSWGVVEHDEAGPARALREMFRILKHKGVAIITVPVDSPKQRRAAELLYRPAGTPQAFFQYFMTPEELAEELRSEGFEILETGTLPSAVLQLVSPVLSARLHGIAFRLANLLATSLFSWMQRYRVMTYCVGRKPAA